MQENNFETTLSGWRRLSGEPHTDIQSTTFVRCMADKTNNELFPNQSVSIKKIKRLRYFGHKTTGYYDLFLSSMSGDTTDRQIFKKKEEETAPLVSDRTKLQPAPSDGLPSEIEKTGNTEEKQEFLKQDKEESKEAAGDSYEKDNGNDYLENKESLNKAPDAKWEKDNGSDKVDSVRLHAPPPHKARSSATTEEEEDCGIKCLYYTLQCCDCVLM